MATHVLTAYIAEKMVPVLLSLMLVMLAIPIYLALAPWKALARDPLVQKPVLPTQALVKLVVTALLVQLLRVVLLALPHNLFAMD